MKNTEKSVHILGVKIDSRERKHIYKEIEEILKSRRGAKIFTPNGEILYKIRNDKDLKSYINSADLSLPDGISIILGGKILGERIPSRLSGIDAAEFILDYSAKNGLSVYLLGGEKEVAKAAAARLTEKYPSLQIIGTHHGYFTHDSEEEKEILREIRRAAPDILFVCLGAPAQERWITKNSNSLPSLRLSMGLGGSLDVWSGEKKRAPGIVRALGLEWLYRILQSPQRIKRLPDLVGYFFAVGCQALNVDKQKTNCEKDKGYRI